ncbi:hypothetical protein MTR67_047833 [Solanum verrucosum]|uniref:Uncharacterized protein n=1 Tax=Solanum verrucosum TaxID=315347 RepID=A0AAF0V0B8_SOLVR|nr:hypothetical protein MTR67_047833 [Solanum verrucosum]
MLLYMVCGWVFFGCSVIDYIDLEECSFPMVRCEERFLNLKALLPSAPILTFPIDGHGFKAYSDPSGVDLGCVLME